MKFYYLLLLFSFLGICGIYIRKRGTLASFNEARKKLKMYGHKYFLRHFKKESVVAAIEPKIPIENSSGAAAHCPAVALADESAKPELDKDEKKDLKIAFEKAQTALTHGDLDSADKNFVKVLSFDENHLEANLNLGLIYLKKGLAAKAEAIYKKLLGLKCADAVIYSNLGNSFYQQQKFSEACEAYTKAVELDPQNPRRFMNLGRVLHEMGNFDGAIEHISKAITLENNPDYHAAIADVYISLGNFDRAKEIIDSALILDKKNLALKVVAKKLKAKKKRK